MTLRSGPLVELNGILVWHKTGARFVASVDLIQRSVVVELDESDLAAAQ